MRTAETTKTDDLMAIWQATGGAMATVSRIDDEGADGGLKAAQPSFACGLIDDGLAATAVTAGDPSGYSCTDDGLEAGGPTHGWANGCLTDDGLAAASFTQPADTCWN